MICIVDYGMGNLASVYNAFRKVDGEEVIISSNSIDVNYADKLVLPGVGAFEDAIRNIEKLHLDKAILDFIKTGRSFLGICLGMQMLFERSYENGVFDGLGVLKGEVVRFNIELPVPHMGWNQLRVIKKEGIFDILKNNSYFYFDHAYYVIPSDSTIVATTTDYGIEFVSSVIANNVYALQYHPEKSHQNGLELLRRFLDLN